MAGRRFHRDGYLMTLQTQFRRAKVVASDEAGGINRGLAILAETREAAQALANIGMVKDAAALALVDFAVMPTVQVSTGRAAGVWSWDGGDLTALKALDTQNGMFIASGLTPSPVGAWRRQVNGAVQGAWFGAVPTAQGATPNDITTQLQAAVDVAKAAGFGRVELAPGWHFFQRLRVPGGSLRLRGLRRRIGSVERRALFDPRAQQPDFGRGRLLLALWRHVLVVVERQRDERIHRTVRGLALA